MCTLRYTLRYTVRHTKRLNAVSADTGDIAARPMARAVELKSRT